MAKRPPADRSWPSPNDAEAETDRVRRALAGRARGRVDVERSVDSRTRSQMAMELGTLSTASRVSSSLFG
jgi:hypothetical protein